MTASFSELEFHQKLRENNQQLFLKMVASYEKTIATSMRAQGFKRVNEKERTVTFSFGTMTFSRSRWKKGNVIRVPLDEQLGLIPRQRFSQEFLYLVTVLASFMPYRKVVEVFDLLQDIGISKNVVHRAVSEAGNLIKQKEEYDSWALSESIERKEKIKTDIIYIEGDGFWVRKSERSSVELSHFVVHTGSDSSCRKKLQNKFEVINSKVKKAKDTLLDYITTNFELAPGTTIITNSDGGKGYTPSSFREFVKFCSKGEHIHFWDPYHVSECIKKNLTPISCDLADATVKKIKKRDRTGLKVILDTAESLLETDAKIESFQAFKKRIINDFSYTASPKDRGLGDLTIGVMESQHRKMTYRMKKRGMYWSEEGAVAMAQIILLYYSGDLRDIFFGSWRKEYKKIKKLDHFDLVRGENKSEHLIPGARVARDGLTPMIRKL